MWDARRIITSKSHKMSFPWTSLLKNISNDRPFSFLEVGHKTNHVSIKQREAHAIRWLHVCLFHRVFIVSDVWTAEKGFQMKRITLKPSRYESLKSFLIGGDDNTDRE